MFRKERKLIAVVLWVFSLVLMRLPAVAQSVQKPIGPNLFSAGKAPIQKSSPYRHPSFIAGVTLLSVGVLLGVTAGVLRAYDGVPYPDGVCDGERRCVLSTEKSALLFVGFSAAALAGGMASTMYWGVKINIP